MIHKVIYIVGPTASGKTDLANKLSLYFNIPVISMDSMQIYKELNIGTSKPSNDELNEIEYYGIDLIEPDVHYSVKDYLNYVKNIIKKIDKKAAIISGGTGLYYDSLTSGFSSIPSQNMAIRQKYYKFCEENGVERLYKLLENVDPIYASKISKNDTKRIIRALEVYEITGKPFSSFHIDKDIKPINCPNLKFGIMVPRTRLYERVNIRVDKMFEFGLLNEAEKIYKKYKDKDLPSLKALGYSDLFEYFEGKISLDTAKENIKKRTRNYAKRQYTWFKKDKNIKWLMLLNEDELNIAKNLKIDNLIQEKLKRKKNRSNFNNIEDELIDFIGSIKNFIFLNEERTFHYLKDEISNFLRD
ncbi:MAG: tRNA (adenosine(37)-N6)-dimethylallyltransferase MiaA [Exilispira sp.]